MNNAVDKARRMWNALKDETLEFGELCVLAGRRDGVVHLSPDSVVIAFPREDEWIVVLAVGDPAFLFSIAPSPRKYVCWTRAVRGQDVIRRCRWDRLQSHFQKSSHVRPGLV